MEVMESPPRARKSSSGPTRSRPRTSANAAHSTRSTSVAGSRSDPPAATSGAGSAAWSSLPLGVSGISSSTTTAAGTMASGSTRASAAHSPSPSGAAPAAGTT